MSERALEAVREAFVAYARGEWTMPPKVYVPAYPAGDFRAMPALGAGHAVLKWVTSFPGNPAQGLPTVTGLVLLSDASKKHGVPMHMHLLETALQKEYAWRRGGCTAVEYIDRFGMLGPNMTLGHGVWLNESDIDRLAETGTCVCHNCSSNFRLRSGIAALNHEVTRQAAMIAYNDDFALMLGVILVSLPLLLLVRGPRREPISAAADD